MIYPGQLVLDDAATADASGTATLAFDPPPPEQYAFVSALTLVSNQNRPGASWAAFVAGRQSGIGSGAAAVIRALALMEGDRLTVTVTGLQPGDTVTATGSGFTSDDPIDVLMAQANAAAAQAFALASSGSIAQPPAPSGFTRLRITGSVAFNDFLPVDANGRTQLWLYHLAILPEQSPSAGSGLIADSGGNVIIRFSPGNTPTITPLPLSGILFDTSAVPRLLTQSWLQVKNGNIGDIFDYMAVWAQT